MFFTGKSRIYRRKEMELLLMYDIMYTRGETMDFTLSMYEKLIDTAAGLNSPVVRFDRWLEGGKQSGIVLRHDVDRKPENAFEVAVLESKKGIESTYFFRTKKVSFNKEIINEISSMGHEIGYHYENLSDCKGNMLAAYDDFRKNLDRLRDTADIRTICMHGRPLSKWDNRDLWKEYSYTDLGILGEPYLDIDFNEVSYFTDTGRTWHPRRFNRRDIVPIPDGFSGTSTLDLISFLKENHPERIMILAHPERWNSSFHGYFRQLIVDASVNTIKTILNTK